VETLYLNKAGIQSAQVTNMRAIILKIVIQLLENLI